MFQLLLLNPWRWIKISQRSLHTDFLWCVMKETLRLRPSFVFFIFCKRAYFNVVSRFTVGGFVYNIAIRLFKRSTARQHSICRIRMGCWWKPMLLHKKRNCCSGNRKQMGRSFASVVSQGWTKLEQYTLYVRCFCLRSSHAWLNKTTSLNYLNFVPILLYMVFCLVFPGD